MASESLLQKKCIAYLKERGFYHINVYGGGRTAKGAPDLITCIGGQFVAFELKVDNNQMQPDQVIHSAGSSARAGNISRRGRSRSSKKLLRS